MHRATRAAAGAALTTLLALAPATAGAIGRPDVGKRPAKEGPLTVEVDRRGVMLGDDVTVEATYEIEWEDDGPGEDVEDGTDDGIDAMEATGPTAPVHFAVDHGDGSTPGELAITKVKVKADELEIEAEGRHRYEQVGTYVVTVTATPATGEAVTATASVTVTTDPVPYPRRGKHACPDGAAPAEEFLDVKASSPHGHAVRCLAGWKLVAGTKPGAYAPGTDVSRAQLATMLDRVVQRAGIELPAGRDAFTDDNGSVHEASINRLAAAGLVSGTSASTFRPDATVSRAQMATLLVRAYERVSERSLNSAHDYFTDDSGNFHERNINLAAAAGFTTGRSTGSFAPGGKVTREQIATFLMRMLDLLVAADGVTR
jgi:hypothetical protein